MYVETYTHINIHKCTYTYIYMYICLCLYAYIDMDPLQRRPSPGISSLPAKPGRQELETGPFCFFECPLELVKAPGAEGLDQKGGKERSAYVCSPLYMCICKTDMDIHIYIYVYVLTRPPRHAEMHFLGPRCPQSRRPKNSRHPQIPKSQNQRSELDQILCGLLDFELFRIFYIFGFLDSGSFDLWGSGRLEVYFRAP